MTTMGSERSACHGIFTRMRAAWPERTRSGSESALRSASARMHTCSSTISPCQPETMSWSRVTCMNFPRRFWMTSCT